jgi:hypothetical protein
VLVGLTVLLFPDGQLPAPRLRRVLWPYLGVAALWALGTVIVTVGAIASHRTGVDCGGTLLLFDLRLHSSVAVAAATLAGVVHAALEPAHISVWVKPGYVAVRIHK